MQREAPKESGGERTGPAGKPRGERRRGDTRRRLMRAAYEIIARRGFDGLVIQDITQAADVGYGSFYNYFLSKEAIVAAVAEAARDHMADLFSRMSSQSADRAEAFGLDLRMWLHLSRTDGQWGWFALRTVLTEDDLRASIGALLKQAIDAGMADGSFKPADPEMARETIAGLLLLGTLKLVSARVADDYTDKLVATCLRTLGLSEEKINAVMALPLPQAEPPPFLDAPR